MYAKLFGSILDSSLWAEDLHVRVLFVTMIAMADREGFVFAAVPGLAHRARLSREQVDDALQRLSAPDPDSSDRLRNPENEGRRIETADGGWKLLNYPYYRGLKDADERREQVREAVRRHRARKRVKAAVIRGNPGKPSDSEAESYSETLSPNGSPPVQQSSSGEESVPRRTPRPRSNGFHPPSVPEVKKWVAEHHPEWTDTRIFDAVKFCAHYDSVGWIVGKKRMVNWHAAAVGWARREEERKLDL